MRNERNRCKDEDFGAKTSVPSEKERWTYIYHLKRVRFDVCSPSRSEFSELLIIVVKLKCFCWNTVAHMVHIIFNSSFYVFTWRMTVRTQTEEKLAGKRRGSERFQDSRTSGMAIDLWWAPWAAGVGSVVGSEGLGGRGHRAEGRRGRKATTAGLWRGIGMSWQAH